MAPKSKPVSLMTFAPTESELAAARALLSGADAKKTKSLKNSMDKFLRDNAGDGNSSIAAMDVGKRFAYIEKYLCYQTAKKSGRMINTRSNVVEKLAKADVVEWNEFRCVKEVGQVTFGEWILSGKLPWIADHVTGSDAKHMRLHLVPQKWLSNTIGEKDEQRMESDGVATSDDLQNFESLRGPDGASSSGGDLGVVGIKPEPKSQADIEKEVVEVFSSQRNEKLIQLNQIQTELKILSVTASESRQTALIGEDALVLSKKMTKVSKSLEQWITEPGSLKDQGLLVLVRQYNALVVEKQDLDDWAAKMKIGGEAAKGAKKARKA